jgi:Fe-S cluster assembly protein SufD
MNAIPRSALEPYLPSLRDEAWRQTNLRASLAPSYARADADAPAPALPALDGARIVFVNGVHREALLIAPDTCTLEAGQPAANAAAPGAEKLTALNAAFASEGAVIAVPEGINAGRLLLVSAMHAEGEAAACHPRHRIHLAKSAQLAVLEITTGSGTYLANSVAEITLAEGAHLTHVRLIQDSEGAVSLATIYVDAAAGATYDSFTMTLGAKLARTEIIASLNGPNATVHLNGAQLLDGKQLGNISTTVNHNAPSCASRQTVKNVLNGHAHGVFQGRIAVARHAQKTDGYQMNQALLLSDHAQIDSKPELEIYADDVKCSHGATVGELAAEQLFYLRSRGIPQAEARRILVHAFLDEALNFVGDEAIRALLGDAMDAWWKARTP